MNKLLLAIIAYIIIAFCVAWTCAYRAGKSDKNTDKWYFKQNQLEKATTVGLFWPVIAIALPIALPFAILGFLWSSIMEKAFDKGAMK